MNVGINFTLASLFYIILLMVAFFTKKRINRRENRIYSYIIITSLFGVIIGIGCYYCMKNMDVVPLLNIIFSKLYLVYLITWLSFFCLYIVVITFPKINYDKWIKTFILAYFLLFALVFTLPLYCVSEGDVVYSYGPATNLIYGLSGLLIIVLSYCMIKKRKELLQKKYFPLLFFVLLGGGAMVLQKLNPGLLLLTYAEAFITFLMYFTIENPDVRMLNELYKNKELMDQNYEDKYNFLFEMTQEARNPLTNINSVYNEIRDEEDIDKIRNGLMRINNLTRQLDFSINNILNISSLDVQKLKIVNSKYDLEKLIKDLEVRVKPDIMDDVELHINLPKKMPILYGDYMKIRQVLYSILINACKNTVRGSINIKVNLIEKYDVCRVIINISDTGRGIPLETINEIISSTGELDKEELASLEKKEFNVKVCQKVMKIMGGNLLIKSNVGEGTDVILSLDQRVYHEKEKSVLNEYESDIASYQRVLVVAQNKGIIREVKRILGSKGITSSVLYYGKDAVDKIKSGKEYNFILIEDEMKEMSGLMTFKAMQEITGFHVPTIVMLQKDKDPIKKHYLEDGFNDYLLVDNMENELERIIEKY